MSQMRHESGYESVSSFSPNVKVGVKDTAVFFSG